MRTVSEVAKELNAYVKDRASVENTGYNLAPEFFEAFLEGGVTHFFGVMIEDGEMVYDDQEPWPGYLEAWKQTTDDVPMI